MMPHNFPLLAWCSFWRVMNSSSSIMQSHFFQMWENKATGKEKWHPDECPLTLNPIETDTKWNTFLLRTTTTKTLTPDHKNFKAWNNLILMLLLLRQGLAVPGWPQICDPSASASWFLGLTGICQPSWNDATFESYLDKLQFILLWLVWRLSFSSLSSGFSTPAVEPPNPQPGLQLV
jgi:hypothetical protein